jgi:c-di-GMP phosphodiesterase
MERYSTIRIRETNESKTVKISSNLKPDLDSLIIDKWQSLLDITARIVGVPSGLIMRLNEKTIEVFLKSETTGNPYKVGGKAELIYGLYCENVIGTQLPLLVPNATKSLIWNKNNPDVDINMISYLGFPINWPDGEVFGTICLLDNKENHYNDDYRNLLMLAKQQLETDLELLQTNNELHQRNIQLKQLNNMKSKFLALISHDVRGMIGTLDQLLKLVITDFENFEISELKEIIKSSSMSASSSYRILEDLLIWSKNDLIQFEPNKTDVDIVNCIESLLHDFQQEINIKRINIVKEYCAPETNILADNKMVMVILHNILSNAIKYTHLNGKISIKIYYAHNHYITEIEDTGIGMEKSSVENLFHYDISHKSKGTNGESSAGIGLMLVKEFLDKNKATIEVESQVGVGSKFKIKWY